jgi:hypothetical protein
VTSEFTRKRCRLGQHLVEGDHSHVSPNSALISEFEQVSSAGVFVLARDSGLVVAIEPTVERQLAWGARIPTPSIRSFEARPSRDVSACRGKLPPGRALL